MGKKGQLLTKRGKPKGRTKLYSSRDVCECCVPQCSVIKRNDKLQEGQDEMVLFNDEAIAETVGSLMVLSIGKNRYLELVNFGKEMVLMFNLHPMHILSEAFIPELIEELLEKKKKRMFRKRDGAFPSRNKRLVSEVLSASLFNFRRKEEESLRLPLGYFRKM